MNKLLVNKPYVTVFMAVFNGEKYIKDAIESVLNQNFTDFELLIVNDGSTDGTLNLIAEFKDPRIRLLHNDGNKGLTFTRNHGLAEAKGKYFAILDSDDIAMPNRLKTQVDFMNANPKIAICGGQAKFIDGADKEITGYKVPVGDNLSHQLSLYNVFINSTLMMKTDAIREVGGYREVAPAEDYDLSFRIALKNQVANLNDKLVAYREHGNNISKVQTEKLKNCLTHIIASIHSSLSIPFEKKNILIHQNILNSDFAYTDSSEFGLLLSVLKVSNDQNKIYDQKLFTNFLFETWFKILREKKEKKILQLYFKKPLFDWSFVTFKHVRKVAKQAFFMNMPFSKN